MLILLLTALFGTVPILTDLAADSATARARSQPIVLYVSRSDCTFCKRFEQEVLAPLIKSARFEDQVIYRELVMDASTELRDRQGRRTTPANLATQLEVHVTPTLLFLDGHGRSLVRPKLGYDGNEFFSYYFERAIALSIERAEAVAVSDRVH